MDAYHELFSNRPSKIVTVAYSSILGLVFTPFLYSIILFERDNHHRTLINQLVASLMWTGIFWNLTVQPLAVYRFIFGPVRMWKAGLSPMPAWYSMWRQTMARPLSTKPR